MSINNLLKVIQTQRKENDKKEKFSGTFTDYLRLLEKHPELVKSAHKRLYEALIDHGVERMPDSNPRKSRIFDNDDVTVYEYFEKEFVGMER